MVDHTSHIYMYFVSTNEVETITRVEKVKNVETSFLSIHGQLKHIIV